MERKKLLVIGLDCATPSLFFDKHLQNIPTIARLQLSGNRASLRSSDPPITIPAWMCMATGRTPGQLGVYGFKHLHKGTYDKSWIASSSAIKQKTAWEVLGEHGYSSIIVGIPPTYPVKPFNGHLVSGFLTPSTENAFTHPPGLKKELLQRFGHYTFDVPFRIEEKHELFKELVKMTRERHEVIKYLLSNKSWDLCWFVEIGLDRMHHAYWKYFDPHHKDFEPDSEFKGYITEYERLLDSNVRELIDLVPDDTRVIVVSDHGAQPMDGCVCVNEWLLKEGYLTLNKYPDKIIAPEKASVDWTKTKAIGWGGYYARVFLNVQGREPSGVIPLDAFEKERQALRKKIEDMKGPDGKLLGNKTFISDELYPDGHEGDDPDLYVYFGDLTWRSAGTIGHNRLYLEENDTGPDDAVHAKHGVFIDTTKVKVLNALNVEGHLAFKALRDKPVNNVSIYDIYPTILHHFSLKPPAGLRGRAIMQE